MPPPCDWEVDRPKFNNGFMHSYILEWRENKDIPVGPTGFENNKFWISGELHIDGNSLQPALDHEISIPTPGETAELEAKRLNQTSHSSMLLFQAKREKLMNNQKRLAKKILRAEKNMPEVSRPKLEVNPFSPKIAMYLRPVEERDSEQIAQIYNRHVAEGNITEDQVFISKDDTMRLFNKNKNDKLPFIVAVAGEPSELVISPNQDSQELHQDTVNSDKIIGFALSERYNYGFSDSVMGRSRYTSILQLFVAHDYQRQGVGRNLLDRLIHTLSTAYAYKKACKFINPHGDRVNECEGSGIWHQVIFHVPVLRQDDPEFPRIKNFLSSRFLFKEVGRTKSTGRSNISRGPANWLDMVIFQLETSQAGTFDPFC
ncbi:hypothetical protein BGHDH14_bgh05097 [Blumeria hordei DH14]|uniref:N-acetyltransferase domain-containing protein n=1 Tax=Blumeria graminis f. sp. hordei (strain DH14) TaxID=546991 RepID=N1JD48_BLUG1|nr:hypothetical protein BGHDH14_bgh05097 [Blumeria hordei DH14]